MSADLSEVTGNGAPVVDNGSEHKSMLAIIDAKLDSIICTFLALVTQMLSTLAWRIPRAKLTIHLDLEDAEIMVESNICVTIGRSHFARKFLMFGHAITNLMDNKTITLLFQNGKKKRMSAMIWLLNGSL